MRYRFNFILDGYPLPNTVYPNNVFSPHWMKSYLFLVLNPQVYLRLFLDQTVFLAHTLVLVPASFWVLLFLP